MEMKVEKGVVKSLEKTVMYHVGTVIRCLPKHQRRAWQPPFVHPGSLSVLSFTATSKNVAEMYQVTDSGALSRLVSA